MTGRLNRLLVQAEDEAKRLKDEYVSVEHVLLAMLDDKGVAGRLLSQSGLNRDHFMQALREVRGNQRVTSPNPETTYQSLERYGRDLTDMARQGKLIRSLDAMRRSGGSSRSSREEPRTIRF